MLWGTLFPILSEWVRGSKITVGPPFFNTVNVPLGLLLLALTGVGPLIAWRKASTSNLKRQFAVPGGRRAGRRRACSFALGMRDGYALVAYTLAGFVAGDDRAGVLQGHLGARAAFTASRSRSAFVRLVARNRRRYGGYIVHAGIVMLFAAFAGLAFKKEHDVTLQAPARRTSSSIRSATAGASSARASRRRRRSTGSSPRSASRCSATACRRASSRARSGSTSTATSSRSSSRSPKSASAPSAKMDLYVVLAGVRDETAELRISFNPLVVWVWIGGMIMAIGGLIVMWPQAERRRAPSGYVRDAGRRSASWSATS